MTDSYERELVVIGELAGDRTGECRPCRRCEADLLVPADDPSLNAMLASGGTMLCQPCATTLFNAHPENIEAVEDLMLCEICGKRTAVMDIPAFRASSGNIRLFVCRVCAAQVDLDWQEA